MTGSAFAGFDGFHGFRSVRATVRAGGAVVPRAEPPSARTARPVTVVPHG
ncbi:hypothetical protein [Streptomyces hyaluromycini]|nr:hypothetical protein [Streptomyces hyaluromycini]